MIHVGFISTLGRLRDIDRDQVASLAESIKEVGLLNPITVYHREIIRNGQPCQGFGLIAGAHRLEACKSLGWQEVPAVVVDLDEHHRVIAECDENLCGSKLTAAEQAIFTAKRKAAYLALHPETEHGRNQHAGVAKSATPSFADDQSQKTGVAARTVRQNAERGEKVSPAALALLKGTNLDKGTYLDKLKSMEPEEQVRKVSEDLKPQKRQQSDTQKAAKIDADVKARAATEVAEMIAEHVPGEWWDAAKANLYASGAKNIADALSNIIGQSVMDGRYNS